ncbi:MEP1B [Cordylochernes scorpioides]|nr:MEP1B [Cordylochernes scorpioides]
MDQFHNNTCVKFVPRTWERDYVKLVKARSDTGCKSFWGRYHGQQKIILDPSCFTVGAIAHELNHAVGFAHEQMRSDALKYIRVDLTNLPERNVDARCGQKAMCPVNRKDFRVLGPDSSRLLGKFDYNSLMLYGSYEASKDKSRPSAVGVHNQIFPRVRDKPGLSPGDIEKINLLYNCEN